MIYAYSILVKIKCLRNVCSKFNTGYFRGKRIARGEHRIKLVGLTLFYTLLYFVFSLFHGSEDNTSFSFPFNIKRQSKPQNPVGGLYFAKL